MNIKKLLKSKGLRAGKVRLEFLEHLQLAGKPLCVSEILNLKCMKDVSKSTIYRNIDDLLRNDIIVEVPSHLDEKFYEINETHHHHFNCVKCNEFYCLDLSEFECSVSVVEKKLKNLGMQISRHVLSFEGICINCNS